jgi:hypothetical protein
VTLAGTIAALSLSTGCGDDGSSVQNLDIEDLAGTYSLTLLAFDPQGALPEANILPALGVIPELIVTTSRTAQVVFQDPGSGLFTTIAATVRTTKTGLRVNFAGGSEAADLLLPRTTEFQYNETTRTLTLDEETTESVRRQRLVALVPDWQNEQLLDPVPGRLRVTFQRQP